MINIIIVEDQTILRDSLATAINLHEDMNVVAKLADASQSLEAVIKHQADLVLMDVCTENGSNGIAATKQIKELPHAPRVIIMTGMSEITFIEQAKKVCADSFIYKNISTNEFMSVIRSTMEGYSTFPQPNSSLVSGTASLTETEMEILRMVCKTKTRKEIAAELYMSEGTVKRHISSILIKTGYDNILRLAVHVVAKGSIIPYFDGGEAR